MIIHFLRIRSISFLASTLKAEQSSKKNQDKSSRSEAEIKQIQRNITAIQYDFLHGP